MHPLPRGCKAAFRLRAFLRQEASSLDIRDNLNGLTPNIGTSTLARGTSAHSGIVEVQRYDQALPEVKVFRPPPLV